MHWAVKFKFETPLHIGETGFGEENVSRILRSDTLFSAITTAYSKLFGDAECTQWIDDIITGRSRLKITSTFPFIEQDEHTTFYCPKPSTPPPGFEQEKIREEWGKEMKKSNYIPLPLFIRWLQRENFEDHDYEMIKCERERVAVMSVVEMRPRVALDRIDQHSELYMQAAQVFAPDTGLYVLLDTQEQDLSRLQACLRWLGDNGIGGKRSTGYGRFLPTFVSLTDTEGEGSGLNALSEENASLFQRLLQPIDSANAYLLLSLYHPQEEERKLNWDRASIQWIDRKGWAQGSSGNQSMRGHVRMIAEGSVVSFAPHGELVNVTPQGWKDGHPVYRSGIAYEIPIVQPWGKDYVS